jgi:hypothetical protein
VLNFFPYFILVFSIFTINNIVITQWKSKIFFTKMIIGKSSTKSDMRENFQSTLIIRLCVKTKTYVFFWPLTVVSFFFPFWSLSCHPTIIMIWAKLCVRLLRSIFSFFTFYVHNYFFFSFFAAFILHIASSIVSTSFSNSIFFFLCILTIL